jgi:hypothetical protein
MAIYFDRKGDDETTGRAETRAPEPAKESKRPARNYLYCVLWCTTLFSDILQVSFPYAAKSRKTAILTSKSGEKPEKSSTAVALGERFPACNALGGWYQERALQAPAPSPDHNG